jgi:hypothetical protein
LKHGFHALIGALCLGCSCQFQNYNLHFFPFFSKNMEINVYIK